MNQQSARTTNYRLHALLALIAALVILTAGRVGAAADLPNGFSETLVTGGLDNPTSMAFAPDGRLFVLQQGGQARIVKDGALLPTPFLSLPVSSQGERGLLGITFDPDFATNQYVYVFKPSAATSTASANGPAASRARIPSARRGRIRRMWRGLSW